MNRFRAQLTLAFALAAALTIAACGGGGGDEDPKAVLDATFSNEATISSGVLDFSLDFSAEGGANAGSFEAGFNGPFQGGGDGAVPSFDLDAELKFDSEVQDFSGSAGLISTGDSAFLSFQGTDYEVPTDLFGQFKASFEQAQAQAQGNQQQADPGNFLASLGINPADWLTDLSNEGNEDVEGTETIHISGQADVPKLVADVQKIVEQAPQAADQVTPEQLGQLGQLDNIVSSAEFDVYSGADDDILRKLEAKVALDLPATGAGTPETAEFGFAITLSELNQPQTIVGPTGAQPLSTLLQQFGIDPSQLGALGAAAGGGASGSGSAPGAGGASPGAQPYLDCLAEAQGQDAIDQCTALIQ